METLTNSRTLANLNKNSNIFYYIIRLLDINGQQLIFFRRIYTGNKYIYIYIYIYIYNITIKQNNFIFQQVSFCCKVGPVSHLINKKCNFN